MTILFFILTTVTFSCGVNIAVPVAEVIYHGQPGRMAKHMTKTLQDSSSTGFV